MNALEPSHHMEFFQILFHQTPDAIVLMDAATPELPIVECNEAFCRMNGFTRDQLIGQSIKIVTGSPVNSAKTHFEWLELLRREGATHFEFEHRRVDGSTFPIETSNSLVTLEGREFLLGIDRDVTQKKAMEVLRRSEEGFRAIYEMCPDGINLVDPETRVFVDCNEAFCRMNGYSREEIVGKTQNETINLSHEMRKAVERRDAPLWEDILAGTFLSAYNTPENGEEYLSFQGEDYHQRKDGTVFPIAYTLAKVVIDGRELDMGIDRDISILRLAQHLQRDTNNILEMIVQGESLPTILAAITVLVERQNTVLRTAVLTLQSNRAYCLAAPGLPEEIQQVLGTLRLDQSEYASASLLDVAASNPVVLEDLTRTQDDSTVWQKHNEIAISHGFKACWLTPIASSSGGVLGFFATYSPKTGAPSPRDAALLQRVSRLAAVAIDHSTISQQLEHRAHHDALTGLPNRVLFGDRLEQALSSAKRRNEQVALMFLDLDGFKQVNDTLGHHFGDVLLQQVAVRLTNAVRVTDTVSRMGGDEFTVILTGLNDTLHTDQIATKILETIEAPFEVHGHQLFVTASIGIALFRRDGEDSTTLQSHADAAMYRAKAAGKNTYEYFEPSISEALRERDQLKTQLRQALERNEFEVFYQPQFDLKSGEIAGFEALLRWKHPQLGVMLPASFIPAAEETGLIIKIGAWVLEEACKQAKQWNEAGHEIKIGVNISALQFGRTEFSSLVTQALHHSGLPPHLLELELAESIVMRNVEESARQMKRLRQLGVCISLDDFGTGYSGLAYLNHLPVNSLKIDRTFIHHNGGPHYDARPLLHAIIELGHSLNIRVMAEGIETESERELLHELGCDLAQGFYLGRPMTSALALQLLSSTSPIHSKPSLPIE